MQEVPLAVDQVFDRVGKENGKRISREEWAAAWYLIPELIDMMSIDGMRRMANFAAAVKIEEPETLEKVS